MNGDSTESWRGEYLATRTMPDGQVHGVGQMIYTAGLIVGLHDLGYTARYCYGNVADALKALHTWNGIGDPPGPWIKFKSQTEERLGPGATSEEGGP